MAKRLTKKEKQRLVRKYKLLQLAGEVVIALGLLLPLVPFWPVIQAETNFRLHPPQVQALEAKAQEYPKDEFKVVIPKIGVDAPVLANVDSTNYKEYIAALKLGVAHAKGTAKPGEPFGLNQNTFLFAHSTLYLTDVPKYNAVFIFLKKLTVGDKIQIIYNGKLWNYTVTDAKVVESTELKYLTDQSLEPKLTLQTCDPPGTSLRRLIIQAKPLADAVQ